MRARPARIPRFLSLLPPAFLASASCFAAPVPSADNVNTDFLPANAVSFTTRGASNWASCRTTVLPDPGGVPRWASDHIGVRVDLALP